MPDGTRPSLRALAALLLWAVVGAAVLLAIVLVLAAVAPGIDADVGSAAAYGVAIVVASLVATRHPAPVGRERWVLLLGPALVAVAGRVAWDGPWWPTLTAAVVGGAITAWLVVRRADATTHRPARLGQR